MSQDTFYIPILPQQLRALQGWDVTPAHLAYRVGRGPHLFRSGGSVPLKGGLMVLDNRGFDGLGPLAPFCQAQQRFPWPQTQSGILLAMQELVFRPGSGGKRTPRFCLDR